MTAPLPTFDDVRAAAARIAGHVHRTPVLTSSTLDAELGARVWFKCENFQKVGAFKARGATNAVLALDDATAARGVTTHSSGNHAAALAYASRARGIPCAVVMPDDAPAVKVTAVRGYGAEIVFCSRAEREATCARVAAKRGMTVIPPYDFADVIAGQGTATLELIEDVGELDVVMTPVGGGGLASGACLATAALLPDARVILAEPAAVDDAARSLATGVRQPRVEEPDTVCDGLLTALGELNFAVLSSHGPRVVTVQERDVIDATRWFLERMKIVIEPSCATVLAAMRAIAPELAGLRIGAVLSGGNTDFAWLDH